MSSMSTKESKCQCGLREHIQKMIDKCKMKKLEIENSEPTTHIPDQYLEEERYEYLDNLQANLQFMLDHPEQEQCV